METVAYMPKFALALAVVLLSSCVSAQSLNANAALLPSEIMANRQTYENQVVQVRGYLSIEPDSICLIDPDRANDEIPPDSSLFSVLGLERLRPSFENFAGKVIVVNGRFRSRVAPENAFLLNGCGKPRIEIESDQTPVVLEQSRRS